MPHIRVLIADDHPLFRQPLRQVGEAEADIQAVGEAGDRREAVGLARRIAEESPAPWGIVLTIDQKGGNRPEAIKAGAWGCPPVSQALRVLGDP